MKKIILFVVLLCIWMETALAGVKLEAVYPYNMEQKNLHTVYGGSTVPFFVNGTSFDVPYEQDTEIVITLPDGFIPQQSSQWQIEKTNQGYIAKASWILPANFGMNFDLLYIKAENDMKPGSREASVELKGKNIHESRLVSFVYEAGGHIGEITTMALTPQIAEAVSIPVILAGGVGGGKQFLAAFALGAEGVQVGTKFIVADECTVHDNYKEAIIKAKDRSTVATGNYTGHPVRVIENKLAKELLEMEKHGASVEDLEAKGTGKLRLAAIDGDVKEGSVMAGQVASMVTKRESALEIIEGLIKDLETERERLFKYFENIK